MSETSLKALSSLLEVIERLLGPDGCPWDRKQTISSLQPFFLEEVHELLEAITSEENEKIVEEAGDVLISLIFLATIATKEKLFTLSEICKHAASKLIFRHPHVFGTEKAKDDEDVMKIWEKQKSKKTKRKSILDGIPPTLPLLQRGQKMIHKMQKTSFPLPSEQKTKNSSKEKWAESLFALLLEAEEKEWNAHAVFRKKLVEVDKAFRQWEKKSPEMVS